MTPGKESSDMLEELTRLRERSARLEWELEHSKRAGRRLALRDAVTRALAECSSLGEAAPRLLGAVCETLDWQVGALWIIEPHTDRLRCVQMWHAGVDAVSEFENASRRQTFVRGEGMPGLIWATGQPKWIPDIGADARFPRSRIAGQAGLRASLAFPIAAAREILGVMEFFSADILRPDEELLETFAALGSQIGQFVERKYAEETLDRFFTLSLDMLCIAGYDGYYKRLNPAWQRALGYTVEELMAAPFVSFVHPDDRAATIAETQKLASGADTISFENRYRAKDGSYKWMLWTAAPFASHELIYAAARDITDRKRAEKKILALREDAEAATRAKSEFLARMSHEIRTPLNVVIGMGDLLDRTALSAEQRQYVRVMQRAGGNLLALINDILDLSKVESGSIVLEDIDFEIRDVVDATVEILSGRAKEKGIELAYDIDPRVPARLTGDPDRLRQVLINLAGNALKFTEKGKVRLSVEPDPEGDDAGALRFSVSDTGIGIPREKLDSIFDAFTQADLSTTRKYGGTGLGLAISKRFVELMHGRIWADSVPGSGATFHFTARFGTAAAPRQERGPDPDLARTHAAAAAASDLRVLVVDDSEENRFLISEYLKDVAREVDFAENGAVAQDKFAQNSYDLVLMDLQMPVMDGYTAAERMREHERRQKRGATPILALTASALESEMQKALDAGCTACLRKPIRLATLLEAIGKYAGQTAGAPLPLERILVRIDERLRDVIPGYLANRRADVAALAGALARSDYEAVRELGHKMTGTGLGYGFPKISEIGAALETAARARDDGDIRTRAAELSQYIEQIEIVSSGRR